MNKVSRESVKQLLELEDSVTLSMYLPTHQFPTSENIQEDRIRFKNLIRSAKEALEAQGVEEGVSGQIIDELENSIHENDTFWQHTTAGLAVFASPAGMHYFHLPMECEERVSVGDQYDVTPLLAACSWDAPYYLLALAVHNPVLFKGDAYGVERVAIDLPKSPEEALNIDELHSNSKTVRAGGYGAGNPGVKSHGQGDSRQAGQEERLKFFRIIDDTLLASKEIDHNTPLLLAGTDDEVSGYRESSRVKNLLDGCLSGNYTEATPQDLYTRSWPLIIEEIVDDVHKAEVEKVKSLLGTGKASTDVTDIAAAALEGRVDSLLIGMFTATRDTIRDSEESVTKLVFPDNYESDDIAACSRVVFDQGGKIIGITQKSMPEEAHQAALYRY